MEDAGLVKVLDAEAHLGEYCFGCVEAAEVAVGVDPREALEVNASVLKGDEAVG